MTQDFNLVLEFDETSIVVDCGQVGHAPSEDASMVQALLPGRCEACGTLQIVGGHLAEEDRRDENQMVYWATFERQCGGCDQTLRAEVPVQEYPAYSGQYQPVESQKERNLEPVRVLGLGAIVG